MAINIDTLVHNEFGRSAIDQLEKIMGKPAGQIKPGVDRAVSEVLDGFSLMARDEVGRQTLYEAARYCDDGLVDEPAIFFAGKDQKQAISDSNNALSALVGIGKRDGIATAVQSASNLSLEDANTITGFVSPGVLGVMKRQMLNGAVLDNPDGIGQMLLGETTTATAGGAGASVDHSVPKSAVRQTTTAGNVSAGAGAAATSSAAASVAHEGADLSWLFRWMLPFLLLGGLVLAGVQNCGIDNQVKPVGVVDQTSEQMAKIATLTTERDEALSDTKTAVAEIDRLKAELEMASAPVAIDTTEIDAANAEIAALKEQLAQPVDTSALDAANAEITSLQNQLALPADTSALDAAKAQIATLTAQQAIPVDTGALDAANAEIASLKEQLAMPVDTTALDAANAEIASLKEQLAMPVDTTALDAANAEIASLKEQLAMPVDTTALDAANAEIASLKEQLAMPADTTELDAANAEIARLNEELAKPLDTTALDNATAEIDRLKTELANVPPPVDNSSQIMGLQKMIDDGGLKFAQLESELGTVRSNRDELESSIAQLQAAKTTAEDKLATTTTALQEKLTEANGVSEGLKVEIDGLKQSVAEGEATLAERQAQIDALNAEIEAAQVTVTGLEGERDQLTEDLSGLAGERDTLQAEITALNGELETIRVERDGLNESVAQLTIARDEAISATESEAAKVGLLSTSLDGIKNNLTLITSDRDKVAGEADELRGQITLLNSEIAAQSKELIERDNSLALQVDESIALKNERDDARSEIEALKANLSETMDDVTAKGQIIEAAQGEIAVLQKTVADGEAANASLTAKLEKVTKGRGAAISTVKDLVGKLKAAQSESSLLAGDKQGLEETIAQTEAAIQAKKDVVNNLSSSLSDRLTEAGVGNVAVKAVEDSQAVSITMGSSDLYGVGSAALSPAGSEVLATVGNIIGEYSDEWRVDIEGHTDAQPIGGSLRDKFASNWELSVARAAAAVRYLQFSTGIPADKMSVRGFGEHKPVATNETREGREANRRIEVILRK